MKTLTYNSLRTLVVLVVAVVTSSAASTRALSAQTIRGQWQSSGGPINFVAASDGTIIGRVQDTIEFRGLQQDGTFQGSSHVDGEEIGKLSLELRRYANAEVWQGTHTTFSTGTTEEQVDQFVLWRMRNASSESGARIPFAGGVRAQAGSGASPLRRPSAGQQQAQTVPSIQQQQQQQQQSGNNWSTKWGKGNSGRSRADLQSPSSPREEGDDSGVNPYGFY